MIGKYVFTFVENVSFKHILIKFFKYFSG